MRVAQLPHIIKTWWKAKALVPGRIGRLQRLAVPRHIGRRGAYSPPENMASRRCTSPESGCLPARMATSNLSLIIVIVQVLLINMKLLQHINVE